jgi:hypothetical protein
MHSYFKRWIWFYILTFLLLLICYPVSALTIQSVTPRGTVAHVQQVVARFDVGAIKFGDPNAPAPLTVVCNNAKAGKGTGSWVDEKTWVFTFENYLPVGVRCAVTKVPTFRGISGSKLTARTTYEFHTSNPEASIYCAENKNYYS